MPLPDIEPSSLGTGMFSNNKTPPSGELFDGISGEEEPTNITSGIGEMFKNTSLGNDLNVDDDEEEENKKFDKLEIDKIEIKTAEIGKLIVESLVTKDEEEKSEVEELEEAKKEEAVEKILPTIAEEAKDIPSIIGEDSDEKKALGDATQLDITKSTEPMVSKDVEEPSAVLEPMVSKDVEEPSAVLEPMVSKDVEEPSAVLEPMVSKSAVLEPMVSKDVEEPSSVLEPMVSKSAVLEPMVSKDVEEPSAVLEPMVSETPEETATVLEPIVSETPEETATVLEPMVSKDALEEDKTEATEEKSGIMDTLWDNSPIGMISNLFKGDDEETAVTDGQMQKEQPTEEKPGIMDWVTNPLGTGMDMLFGDDEKSTPEDDTDDVLIDIRDIISEFDLSGGSDVSENLLEETITPPTEATESTEEKSGIMDTLWDTSPIGMISNLLKGDDEEVSNQKTNTETVTNNTENLESQTKTIEENVELKTIEDAQLTVPPNISEQQNKQQGKSSFYSQPNQNTTSPPADPGPKYTKNPPPPVPVGKSISKELQTYIMVPQWRRMLG